MYAEFQKTPLWIRAVALVVITGIGIGGIGWGVQEALTGVSHQEEQAEERCRAGNELRVGLRQFFHDEIRDLEHANPALFPSISPKVFKKLVNKKLHTLEYDVKVRFRERPC